MWKSRVFTGCLCSMTLFQTATVLVIIKLTKFALRCGSCKLKFCRYFIMFCDI